MPNVALVSHSLVAPRQALWAAELRRQLESAGLGLQEVFPTRWGNHYREGGFDVVRPGDMMSFQWPSKLYEGWAKDPPELVLIQNEPYLMSTVETASWCYKNGVPYVVFSWENANLPATSAVRFVLENASGLLFGNTNARKLASAIVPSYLKLMRVVPQVGIDTTLFRPREVENKFDIIFSGRKWDQMKGESVLDAACEGQGWRVAKGHELGFVEYADLPARFSAARVMCTPSLDCVGRPMEQFAPAVSVESLFCGVPVVTTDQSAIFEWLHGCPAVTFAKQGDAGELRELLTRALVPSQGNEQRARDGNRWARELFSNEAVASQYVKVVQEIGRVLA